MGYEKKNKNPVPDKVNREIARQENNRIRGRNTGEADEADWSLCDAQLMRQTVARVVARGCAIQFGRTLDGTTFVIRIVGDGEPYNEYVRPSENVDLYLTGLGLDFE